MLIETGSMERWVCVEPGAVMSNSLVGWSEDAKIGRSAERWRPQTGPINENTMKSGIVYDEHV